MHEIAHGFYRQTGDIPWVIAKQMFQSHKTFPIGKVLGFKTTPDIIAELIAYYGKYTYHVILSNKEIPYDVAIHAVANNENLNK